MTVEPVLRAEGLAKKYDAGVAVDALRDVSLVVAPGEFVAVTGPSGSGKSTLLSLLGGLDAPTRGSVWIKGVALNSLRGDALADFRLEHFGFIFQAFHLIPVLSTLENVMLPLLPHRRRLSFDLEHQARRLLADVGLAARLDHLPSQLSGGEQQRVAIARALVNTPSIILADEPTGNLDSHAADDVADLLNRLRSERGLTVVLVTHNENLARRADRVVRMRDGQLEQGSARQLN